MKNIVLAITIALVAACIDDKGNYTYTPAADLTPGAISSISGIAGSYSGTSMDTLKISPVLEEGADESALEFLWCIYSANLKRDTIGREKDLVYRIALAPALNYQIVLQVTNKQTGIYAFYKTKLEVKTAFAEGWFITKDINQVTDIDIIFPTGAIARDVLKTFNGEGVPGEGIIYADARNITVSVQLPPDSTNIRRDTVYNHHDCFYIMTRNTVQLYDSETMLLMNKIDRLFMLPPARVRPQSLVTIPSTKMIINDDIVYALDTRDGIADIGQWGASIPGGRVDPVNICRSALGGFLVFDTETRSLKQLNTYKNAYAALRTGGNPPANNMNYDMVYMQEKAEEVQGGVAIFKELGVDNYYGATITGFQGGFDTGGYWESPLMPSSFLTNPIATFVQIPPGSNILDAKLYGTHRNMDVVYFSRGDNEVWYYNLANAREEKVVTYPADETVMYAHTLARYSGGTYFNLSVLTEKDGNWNLYIYNFQPSSPLVDADPVATFTGDGIPRRVHYRSPLTGGSF
jgi:hypothetical protein